MNHASPISFPMGDRNRRAFLPSGGLRTGLLRIRSTPWRNLLAHDEAGRRYLLLPDYPLLIYILFRMARANMFNGYPAPAPNADTGPLHNRHHSGLTLGTTDSYPGERNLEHLQFLLSSLSKQSHFPLRTLPALPPSFMAPAQSSV